MSRPVKHVRSRGGTMKSKSRGPAFLLAPVMLAALGIGGVAASSGASAHTPSASATCYAVSVNLVNYQVRPAVPEIPGTLITAEVPAWDETVPDTPAGWQHYSWNGDWDLDSAPPFPDARWQANTASDPHGVGVAGAYFRSHGSSGGGDWFYLEAVAEVSHVVHHDLIPAVYGPSTPAVPASVNHVVVTIDGVVVEDTDFGGSFVKSYPFSNSSVAHTWSVSVTAWDDPDGSHGWTKTFTGTTTPCQPDYFLESSYIEDCGSVEITLRNVSPWIYPMSVEIDGVHSYGPVVDNRGAAPDDQTATRTITFPEDSGLHTVRYRVQAGTESDLYVGLPVGEWTTLTIETNCESETVVEAINQPGSEPPTCTENGHRVDAAPQEGVTIVWTDEQEVIGENPWTAVFDTGFGPADGLLTSGSVVVEAMLPSPGPNCPVMVEVQPLDVTQMVCTASDDGLSQRFSEASIEAPEVEGLTYSIEGGEWTGLEPDTYTVTATPDQYRPIDAESLPEGWTLGQDGTATIDVTVEQAVNCISPFTEKAPTSASTTTCDAVTTVTVMWERKWTIVNNVLVPGDWTEVSRTTDKRDPTAAEIAAKRLVCPTTPTPPVLASTGFNAASLGFIASLFALAGWVLLLLRRRMTAQ